MERGEVVGPGRTPRRHRSVAEKRRIVELALEPGVSVARVAQAEGVNANQVFQWRRAYREGALRSGGASTALLPVLVGAETGGMAAATNAPVKTRRAQNRRRSMLISSCSFP